MLFSKLIIRPWMEEMRAESYSPQDHLEESPPDGHFGWIFEGAEADVVLILS